MIGRTNAGGTGGSSFAFIVATYPSGSTCTCSDGTRTLRAKDTVGAFVFNIPYAATWTVSSTNGTDTDSAKVTITTQGQSQQVFLSYKIYLYRAGNEYSDITGGWYLSSQIGTGGSLTKNTDKMIFKANAGDGSSGSGNIISTKQQISFTNYKSLGFKKLCAKVKSTVNAQAGYVTFYEFGLSTTNATSGNPIGQFSLKEEPYLSGDHIYEVDISAVGTTKYYVFMQLHLGGFYRTNEVREITEVYLSK